MNSARTADTSAMPPRFPLLHGPTPLHEMPRLREALGGSALCPRLLIKRDDLAGPALGGNKSRKLEFLIADALAKRATHLITVGAVQSNHARITAAAARLAGLECVLVLTCPTPDPAPEGNLLLDDLLGATVVKVPPAEVHAGENPRETEAIEEATARIEAEGGRVYPIPLGGSNPLGTLGYLEAAREIDTQLAAMGVDADRLYFGAGSRGTQAGIILGKHLNRSSWAPHGVAVSPGDPEKTERVLALVRAAAGLIGASVEVAAGDVTTHQEYIGAGYAVPTAAGVEAIRLLASTEAVFLDPTYTGKAMAGLIDHIRQGMIGPEETVVFLHTGGAPAIFRRGALTPGT